ncbi:MAG TPA: hypothetical protein VFC24_13080, partial [Casimicrobiaceae bacterium]|nr:hypothetical protein [Casimicrobiaceae bacterium]
MPSSERAVPFPYVQLALFAVCLALSAIGFFVFTQESFRFADFFERVDRASEVQRTLGDLRNGVIAAQDAEQAFVLSGDGAYLAAYARAITAADAAQRAHASEAALSDVERDAEAELNRLIDASR